MDKFQKLVANHAKYSDAVRDLKRQGVMELSKCMGINQKTQELIKNISSHPLLVISSSSHQHQVGCIDNAISINRDNSLEDQIHHGGGEPFSETWDYLVSEGKVCQHCIRVRELKAERVAMIRKLGATRAAITMAGRKINTGGQE